MSDLCVQREKPTKLSAESAAACVYIIYRQIFCEWSSAVDEIETALDIIITYIRVYR